MPIRHTDKGWYWGSKGPFASKDKALAVARAAHASGYREDQAVNSEAIVKFMSCLMQAQITLRLIHWNTTSYAEHKAVGKLYETLADLQDTCAEAYMGVYSRFGDVPFSHAGLPGAADYVTKLGDELMSCRLELPNDSELQNIVDEIMAAIDSTQYLLTLK